ncbi:MAG TPA: TIGR02391 family protein [Candidatus Binataceae bacterium]|nr:TIGR02391 family protein [Candidatus Binataceae bacterium]
MEPEELGETLILLWQNHFPNSSVQESTFDLRRRIQSGFVAVPYPEPSWPEVTLAFSEAWAWLKAQGLAVPDMGQSANMRLSRRARKITTRAQFSEFRTSKLLPREILQPKIYDSVWKAFLRGEYDVAVFVAMKAVEVAVREAASLGNDQLGVTLMRKAFDPKTGALTDSSVEQGEKEARANLFAGAIGSYKNPHSHRDVNLDDPAEALEIVLLANHLLRIVDARVRARS